MSDTEAPVVPRASRALVVGIVVLTVVALVLRAIAIRNTWGFGQDQTTYLETARIFRDGEWRENWTFRYLHPLYPLLIAAIDAFVGDMDLTARGISVVATVAAGAGLGLWWGRRRGTAEGLLVCGAFALNPGVVLYGSETFTEPLTIPLAALTFLVCSSSRGGLPTARRAALAGALFAILTLVKTTCLLFVPGALVAALWPGVRRHGVKTLVAPALAFAAAFTPLAIAPHVATYALRGSFVDFVGRESSVTDAQVLGTEIPTYVADESGTTAQERPDFGEHAKLRKFALNVASVFGSRGARHFYPWFAMAPLFVAGAWILIRGPGGPVRDFWIVAASAFAFEWLVRCGFVLTDRYLLPATIATLPPLAVATVALVRAASRRGFVVAHAAFIPAALVAAAWGWSNWRQQIEPGRRPNVYQEVGKLSAALGDARPRRLVSIDGQVCFFAGARKVRLPKGNAAAVVAYVEKSECDGLVVGPGEIQQNPDLREVLDVPLGGDWRGLRVVAKLPGASILRR